MANDFNDCVAVSVSTENNRPDVITKTGESKNKVEESFFILLECCLDGNFSRFNDYISKNFPYAKAVAARLIVYILSVLVASIVNGCRYAYINEYGLKLHGFKNAFREILASPLVYVPAVACFF